MSNNTPTKNSTLENNELSMNPTDLPIKGISEDQKNSIDVACYRERVVYNACFKKWFAHWLESDPDFSCDEIYDEYMACVWDKLDALGIANLFPKGFDPSHYRPVDFSATEFSHPILENIEKKS